MQDYQHIMLAADFSDHAEEVANRARGICDRHNAKLSLLHVVDNLPITDSIYGPVIPYDVDITAELVKAAETHLVNLGEKLSVPKERRWLELGSPKLEIVRTAEEKNVDLIIVGSHGRHGLALLLGSTANGVLHHAKCDVLAVRLKD